MLGLWLDNTSFSRKVHLGYFAGSFPFPSLQFDLVSISHHTAHQVSLSCRFFRASEWTGSGTQSGSHIQQAQPKGKTKIRADEAWPKRVFSPLQTTRCSATSDTQQQPLLQPGISKASISTWKSDSAGQSTSQQVVAPLTLSAGWVRPGYWTTT